LKQSRAARIIAFTTTPPSLPTMSLTIKGLPPQALEQVAAYFQALAEPTRLQILNLLRDGEKSVGEIAHLTGFTAANVSRHLALLAQRGIVARQPRGTGVWYRIADPKLDELCDLVCGSVARTFEESLASHEALLPNLNPASSRPLVSPPLAKPPA
jgi:DNA-binding transcriptional ArsR family regulator